jgi:hypothetical protein
MPPHLKSLNAQLTFSQNMLANQLRRDRDINR